METAVIVLHCVVAPATPSHPPGTRIITFNGNGLSSQVRIPKTGYAASEMEHDPDIEIHRNYMYREDYLKGSAFPLSFVLLSHFDFNWLTMHW